MSITRNTSVTARILFIIALLFALPLIVNAIQVIDTASVTVEIECALQNPYSLPEDSLVRTWALKDVDSKRSEEIRPAWVHLTRSYTAINGDKGFIIYNFDYRATGGMVCAIRCDIEKRDSVWHIVALDTGSVATEYYWFN